MKRKSTSNLHPNTVKLPKNNTSFEKKIFLEEKPCFSKTMFVCKEKTCVFLTKNDQHIVFFLGKGYQTTLPGIDFSMFMSMKLMAGEPTAMQDNWINFFHGINLKSGKAQVIDSLRVGLHVFFQNRSQKTSL